MMKPLKGDFCVAVTNPSSLRPWGDLQIQHCVTLQRLIKVDFLLEETREDFKVKIRMKFETHKDE